MNTSVITFTSPKHMASVKSIVCSARSRNGVIFLYVQQTFPRHSLLLPRIHENIILGRICPLLLFLLLKTGIITPYLTGLSESLY